MRLAGVLVACVGVLDTQVQTSAGAYKLSDEASTTQLMRQLWLPAGDRASGLACLPVLGWIAGRLQLETAPAMSITIVTITLGEI